jgi:hypothetical protein
MTRGNRRARLAAKITPQQELIKSVDEFVHDVRGLGKTIKKLGDLARSWPDHLGPMRIPADIREHREALRELVRWLDQVL